MEARGWLWIYLLCRMDTTVLVVFLVFVPRLGPELLPGMKTHRFATGTLAINSNLHHR